MERTLYYASKLAFLIVPLVLAVSLSGCLLGLGAAAGAAVGGCSILDENEDERITEAEFSAGLFESWDRNDDNTLSESEFEAGVDREDVFAGWSGEFDEWDTNDNGELTRMEFEAGVREDDDVPQWLDRRCDDLGL